MISESLPLCSKSCAVETRGSLFNIIPRRQMHCRKHPPPPEMTSVVCEAAGTHQTIDNYACHFPKDEKSAACTYVCRDTRGLLLSAPSACSTTHGISCRSDRCALDGREIAAAGGRDDARTVHYLRYVVRLLKAMRACLTMAPVGNVLCFSSVMAGSHRPRSQ